MTGVLDLTNGTIRFKLNGADQGIYLLTERIKRDDDRIALERDDSGETFIVVLDDEGGVIYNDAGYGYWELVYPRAADVDDDATDQISTWLSLDA